MARSLTLLRDGVVALLRLVRYRFFLFAGLIPYILGQAMAYNARNVLDGHKALWGLMGIFLTLAGVELFNEYFDAKDGGDRIFSSKEVSVPHYFFLLGLGAMLFAFLIGLHLAAQSGWLIILFAGFGFLAAYFYVGPPLKWAYRGMGEIIIALSYGPFMLLGSYYLQAGSIDILPVFVSLICALGVFSLAVVNEIPDFYQDRLVGKRNLVVRLGKSNAFTLLFVSMAVMFFLLLSGLCLGRLPWAGIAVFIFLPAIIKGLTAARRDYDNPKVFCKVINLHVAVYLVVGLTLTL